MFLVIYFMVYSRLLPFLALNFLFFVFSRLALNLSKESGEASKQSPIKFHYKINYV